MSGIQYGAKKSPHLTMTKIIQNHGKFIILQKAKRKMSFDIDCWEVMNLIYSEDEAPRQFQIRKGDVSAYHCGTVNGKLASLIEGIEPPYQLDTVNGRLAALIFLYLNLPFELFKIIFNLIIGSSTEVIHPISKELVCRYQMKLTRVVFYRMFVYGPEFDQVMLRNKRFPFDYAENFCKTCGEPKLTLCYSDTLEKCLTKKDVKCRHPRGNYFCHRSIGIMGGVCYPCINIWHIFSQAFPAENNI